MATNKLIVIEGLDGSGKATQARRLTKALVDREIPVREVSFPDYGSDSSALVKMYLAGQFGSDPKDVNAFAASAFFAVDRFASYKRDWCRDYARGIVIADRYTTSNAVHQCSKLPQEQWDAFLAWLFDGKSPVTRAGEQAQNIVKKQQEKQEEIQTYSPALRRRMWKFRLVCLALIAIAVWICFAGNWQEIPVYIATVVLIIGLAMWSLGSPADYNESVDTVAMIDLGGPRKIEEFFDAFRQIQTPFGSAYLATLAPTDKTALIFGPDVDGQYLYFYLSGDGLLGYVGFSPMGITITGTLTQPDFPPAQPKDTSLTEQLCYRSDIFRMKDWLKESLESYLKTGTPLPFRPLDPSQIYTFRENFKLTGQHFTLEDSEGNVCYTVDGTAPLVSLRVLDRDEQEVFRMTKQLGHALTTYKFYECGQLYGTLEKQLEFVRDRFTLETAEGILELRQYSATLGHNYRVTLNGRMLGAIMEDLALNLPNLVFDNAYLIVYEPEKLPLLTAMAVMAAREQARDRAKD